MPRVGNKKSRTGCVRCKSRKVKCDEQFPSCGWCASHSLTCEYPEVTLLKRETSQARSSEERSTVTDADEAQINLGLSFLTADSFHRLELGMLQYYLASVAPTVPYVDRERGLELHANLIPQEALKNLGLQYAVFAYALLHIHMEFSHAGVLPRNWDYFERFGLRVHGSKGDYTANVSLDNQVRTIDVLTLHRNYLGQALVEERNAISNMNKDNADGICCTAILIAMIALVHASQIEPQSPSGASPVATEWFNLQRSFTPCLKAARPVLAPDAATYAWMDSAPNLDILAAELRSDKPFYDIFNWQSTTPEPMSDEEREGYDRAVAYLQVIHGRILAGEPWQVHGRRVLAFPSLMPDSYVRLLGEQRPRAVIILAHILVLSKEIGEHWWIFRGVADYHVRNIATHIPAEWQWAMDWPLNVLEHGIS